MHVTPFSPLRQTRVSCTVVRMVLVDNRVSGSVVLMSATGEHAVLLLFGIQGLRAEL